MSEEQKQLHFAMKRIYLKDTSLETPAGVEIFNTKWQPQVGLEIHTEHHDLGDDHHEVVLTLTATVKNEENTAFLIEVKQAAIFQITGFEPAQLHHALGAYCPTQLYPYARETIDTLATKASFPPLMLAQVNFEALYAEKMKELTEKQKENESGEAN